MTYKYKMTGQFNSTNIFNMPCTNKIKRKTALYIDNIFVSCEVFASRFGKDIPTTTHNYEQAMKIDFQDTYTVYFESVLMPSEINFADIDDIKLVHIKKVN